MSPSPADISIYAARPVVKSWYFMPLMHSEDAEAHILWQKKTAEIKKTIQDAGDQDALKLIDHSIQFENLHYEPISKFGRYPHRNDCLGRQSSPDELEYMKTAHTFGVQQSEKAPPKDEL